MRANEQVARIRVLCAGLTAKRGLVQAFRFGTPVQRTVMNRNSDLRVEDDGQGFSTRRSGLGLRFVRDRAEAIGGSCRVESEPGRGTSVQVWVPRMPGVDEGVDTGGS